MRVDTYQDMAGDWRWRLRADNGRIVAESGEGYSSRRKLADALNRLSDWCANSDVMDAVIAAWDGLMTGIPAKAHKRPAKALAR